MYRPSEQRFYIINALGANNGGLGPADFSFQFGNPGDKPFVGDFDGDGIDEVGLHRESTRFVYYRNTLDTGIASNEFFFGDPADRFVSGDWASSTGPTPPDCSAPETPPSTSATPTARATPMLSSYSANPAGYPSPESSG
jgi:hypothetical protein